MTMNDPQHYWKQLQTFEKRGDLGRQAEVLTQALGRMLPHGALNQTLNMALERAQTDAERNPPELLRLVQERSLLQGCNSRSGEAVRETALPREAGLIPPGELNWTATGQQQVMLLEADKGKLQLLQACEKLAPNQQGLMLNTGYAYLNLPPLRPQTSWFCRSLYEGRIPLETVRSLPLDLFLNPRHPMLAVGDRGAGKLHLYQRDTLKLLRSWQIIPAPNKKAFGLCWHPDGRRLFVTAFQPGLLVMIDRGMAQKRIPLPNSHLISAVGASTRGDQLYVLAVPPDTRRPEIWVLDSEKFRQLSVIHLEGESFCSGADARDIFEITPDGQYAVVMVSKNQPALFTPSLLLVDLASGKIADQLVLRPDQKPINLAFPARELVNPRFRLLPMLLHGGFGLSEDQIKQAFAIDRLN